MVAHDWEEEDTSRELGSWLSSQTTRTVVSAMAELTAGNKADPSLAEATEAIVTSAAAAGADPEWGEWAQQLSRSASQEISALFADAGQAEGLRERIAPYLVECPDGEWAVLRRFSSLENLARRMGQLQGKDMVLWAFFGIPLPFTQGPQRYLLLPDGRTAMMIPLYEGGPVKVIDASLLPEGAIQEDGFIGPVELSQTKVMEAAHVLPQPPPGQPSPLTDEDDDDEDDDDEDDDDNDDELIS